MTAHSVSLCHDRHWRGCDADRATVEGYDLAYWAGELKTLSDGAELYYEVRGPVGAPTLVIVNNHFIICPLWRNFTAELATRFRVVTYDLRNQGAPGRAGADLTFAQHVADLEELLDGLGVQSASCSARRSPPSSAGIMRCGTRLGWLAWSSSGWF